MIESQIVRKNNSVDKASEDWRTDASRYIRRVSEFRLIICSSHSLASSHTRQTKKTAIFLKIQIRFWLGCREQIILINSFALSGTQTSSIYFVLVGKKNFTLNSTKVVLEEGGFYLASKTFLKLFPRHLTLIWSGYNSCLQCVMLPL